jgi:ABC-type uncharacterized transport system substrate-binding protein
MAEAPVEVIFAVGAAGALAASKQTSTVPVVTNSASELLEQGVTQSLARPGRNITWTTIGESTLNQVGRIAEDDATELQRFGCVS